MTTIGKGEDNNGKDDYDGKDKDGGGGGIPDQHTTINYMAAAEEMAAATAMATLMATAFDDNDGKDDGNNGKDNGGDGKDDNTTARTATMSRMTTAMAAAFLPNMQQSTT
jgi:hypothetical protein